MPVFRVQREDGYKRVTIANSLENAQKIVAATAVQRLTALEVLERACVGLDAFEDDLADELYGAMQRLSDTVTDLQRRNPGAFAGDGPAGKLRDAVDAFLSGKWEG